MTEKTKFNSLLPPFPPVQNPRVHLRFFGTMRFAFISLLLFASAPAWAADSIRQWSNQTLHFQYDLTTATYDCQWTGGAILRGSSCAVRIVDDSELTPADYSTHECADGDVVPFSDAIGSGKLITVHHLDDDKPELQQRFWLYDDVPFFIVDVQLIGPTALASNHMAPVMLEPGGATPTALRLPVGRKPLVLFVPYDNDTWVRFNDKHVPGKDPDSYEVTAIYDNASRQSFVLGSVSHDIWKTGIDAPRVEPDGPTRLSVYGGASGTWSRDSIPHGLVWGKTIASPRILVGYFPDWRDGLEAYGRANALLTPPPVWSGGVIFGWNSWAAYEGKVRYDDLIADSDFIKQNLQTNNFHGADGTVYVNWDAGWNKCTDQQIADGVKHVHQNGQKAGIYWSPFRAPFRSSSGGGQIVPGTDGHWRFRDLYLRDMHGNLLPELDNGIALDPTHPGMLAMIDWQMKQFVQWGFDFVKIDFLNFAAREGRHDDGTITTGTAAYNVGMSRIMADCDPKKIGRPFFVSLSIAPLFPAYGHSRRISCDTWGKISDCQYMLNSLTYGWWMSGTIYPYCDPDHVVLNSNRPDQLTTDEEARTRVDASVITGTVFIDSDDFSIPAARARANSLLTNPAIDALARTGRAFRPVEGNTGDEAASVFELAPERPGSALYVAVFNYSKRSISKQLSWNRLGLPIGKAYRLRDLWTGQSRQAADNLQVDLPPAGSTILALEPQ
jgi:alpha-galactosidase